MNISRRSIHPAPVKWAGLARRLADGMKGMAIGLAVVAGSSLLPTSLMAQQPRGATLLAPRPLTEPAPIVRANDAELPYLPPTGAPFGSPHSRAGLTPVSKPGTPQVSQSNPGRYCPDCRTNQDYPTLPTFRELFTPRPGGNSDSKANSNIQAVTYYQGSAVPVPPVSGGLPPTGTPVSQSLNVTFQSKSPAYRWYGYGAPSPQTVADVTPEVPQHWMNENGATAGAFPAEPSSSHVPTQPMVQMAGPPVKGSAATPMPGNPTVTPISNTSPIDPLMPQGMEVPNFPMISDDRAVGSHSTSGGQRTTTPKQPSGSTPPRHHQTLPRPDLVPPPPLPSVRWQSPDPMSSGREDGDKSVAVSRAAALVPPKPGNAMVRAQSPTPDPVEQSIRTELGISARSVEIRREADGTIWVSLTVVDVPTARELANRIAALPELASERVEFEVRLTP